MLHSFFNPLARSRYLSLFLSSFSFILLSAGTAKSTIRQVLFFCCWLSLGLVVWPRFDDPFLSQNSREVCASHFLGRILGCAYTICLYVKRKLYQSLVTLPRAPITTGITVTLMFHSFFNSLTRSKYLYFFSLSVLLCGQPGQQSPQFGKFSLSFFSFLLTIFRSGRLAKISGSVCISKPQSSLYVSFSGTDSGLCIYHLFVWSNFTFLHNSHWITLPTLSCLVLYSFCASLLHSLIMWLIVSSLSQHNLHLLFSCVWSILALI